MVSLISIRKKLHEKNDKHKDSVSLSSVMRQPALKGALLLTLFVSLIAGGMKIVNITYFSSFPDYYLSFALAMVFLYSGDVSVKTAVSLKIVRIKRVYRAMLISVLLYGFSFLMLSMAENVYLAMLGFLILGFGNGLLAPHMASLIQSKVPKEHLTEILGIVNTLRNSARMGSVVLLGLMVSLLPVSTVYLLMGLALLMPLLFLVNMKE
jgi:hypothetical protein